MRRSLLLLFFLLPSCKTTSAPAPDLAPPATVAAAYVPPPPSPGAQLPTIAEVEIAGQLFIPKPALGQPRIVLADGPCWKRGSQAFADVPTDRERYFTEVFVPQGTLVWMCIAIVPPQGPIVYYGEATKNPLLAKGFGEVAFMDTTIHITKGPSVTLPPLKPPPEQGMK